MENSDPQDEQVSLFTDPNIAVTQDIEVVIDARKAVPITIETPKPSEQQAVLSYYVHREYGNGRSISHGVMHFSTVKQVNVTPTKPVKDGSFEFSSRWQLVAPMVQASVSGVTGPLDINLLHQSPSYEGKKRFRLVYVAAGREGRARGAGLRRRAGADRGGRQGRCRGRDPDPAGGLVGVDGLAPDRRPGADPGHGHHVQGRSQAGRSRRQAAGPPST